VTGFLEYPLWLILLVSLVVVLGCGEIGRRIGTRAGSAKGGADSTLESALLGILALMIGFTFAMGMSRADARREALLNEANAIGTTALRARLLPAPHNAESLKLLREYVQLRLDVGRNPPTPEILDPALARSNAIQEALWLQATAVAAKDSGMVPTGVFIQALNDMIDSQQERLVPIYNHLPNFVLVVLYAIAAIAAGFSGYGRALRQERMENYSAYLEYTDVQIGRVVDAVAASGELDSTLIIYILGDNGASAEGGLEGTVNEIASLNGIQLGLPGLLAKFEQIGGPETEPHVPVGWAWAANTPFRWTKQIASHFGGTRNPMVISWPKRFAGRGELRSQFHHVIDIAPTILEATGIAEPQMVNGVAQKPIEGVSMVYTFDSAAAAERRTVQYFELLGNRAIYKDGWMAATRHGIPWKTAGQETGFDADVWEIFDLTKDFSQANDLATQNSDKLKELQAVFEAEARKYDVYPLDDRFVQRVDSSMRPNPLSGLTSFKYGPGVAYIGPNATLSTNSVAFSITAEIDCGTSAADGVIAAIGGKSSGWSLYVKDGRPTFYYNFFEVAGYRAQSSVSLPHGKSTVRVEVTPEEPGYGKPAAAKLFVERRRQPSGWKGLCRSRTAWRDWTSGWTTSRP
jgi:hypothetical protein